MSFPAALTMMMVFITSDPASYNCAPPPNGFSLNTTSNDSGDGNNTADFDQNCHMYEMHDVIDVPNITSCQYGWEYSHTYGETSIVSEVSIYNYWLITD